MTCSADDLSRFYYWRNEQPVATTVTLQTSIMSPHRYSHSQKPVAWVPPVFTSPTAAMTCNSYQHRTLHLLPSTLHMSASKEHTLASPNLHPCINLTSVTGLYCHVPVRRPYKHRSVHPQSEFLQLLWALICPVLSLLTGLYLKNHLKLAPPTDVHLYVPGLTSFWHLSPLPSRPSNHKRKHSALKCSQPYPWPLLLALDSTSTHASVTDPCHYTNTWKWPP